MFKNLKGIINHKIENTIFIKADNGDSYDCNTESDFNLGDRVIFDGIHSQLSFELALLGGPIPCENVRLVKS
jgi:hypothetical protein